MSYGPCLPYSESGQEASEHLEIMRRCLVTVIKHQGTGVVRFGVGGIDGEELQRRDLSLEDGKN